MHTIVFANSASRQVAALNSSYIASLLCQVNSLIATLTPQSNEPSYSNTVIGTLAVDGWTVAFGTARRGLGRAAARPGPFSLYQIAPTHKQPVYQFVSFDVAYNNCLWSLKG